MGKRLELKASRVRKGYTQLHVSLLLGVTQQTIAKWENGTSTPRSLKQIRALAHALDAPMPLLFPDVFDGEATG